MDSVLILIPDASQQSCPMLVRDLAGAHVVGIAAGSTHSVAVTSTGEVYTFGESANGRLGHGTPPHYFFSSHCEARPRLVRALRGVRVESVAAGQMHSACVDEDGKLLMFGHNRFHQLGLGGDEDKYSPEVVPSEVAIESVACGALHNAAITRGGSIYVWGANQGLGNDNDWWQPMRVSGGAVGEQQVQSDDRGQPGGKQAPRKVLQVSCGLNHTAAVVELPDTSES
eukprot:jgi/Chlat1/5766/Chrsp387S00426